MQAALLDTDACIEIIRGNPAPVQFTPDTVFVVSIISQFEILSGLKGQKGTKVEVRAKTFLKTADIRPFDDSAADAGAKIRIQLESAGHPIGSYDLLLAGHALALNIPIVTGTQNEFQRVPGLKIINWRSPEYPPRSKGD